MITRFSVDNYGMIIGLVLLAIVALLLLFGVAGRVFKSFGVSYPFAYLMVGALIGCAFIPSFKLGSAIFYVGGFVVPVVFAAVFFVLAARYREAWRALVTSFATAALYIAVRLLIEPITSELVTSITLGFLCGAGAYLLGKTKVSALTSVFCGFALGEVISSAVRVYAGEVMRLGARSVFDALIIAAVFSVLLYELVAAIKRATVRRHGRTACENAEASEEFDPERDCDCDSDEYKKYFDE